MRMQLQYYDILESTNITAVEKAAEGAPEGTVIIAAKQSQGSGRMNRVWSSPSGGLWFSIVLRPKTAPEHIAQLTLLAGVAVLKTVKKLYRNCSPKIKWPNDLLLDGKKFCGILSEMRLDEKGAVDYAVLGIGVNVNLQEKDFPEELKNTAVSLLMYSADYHSCNEVLMNFLNEFTAMYSEWLSNGSDNLFCEWKSNNCTIGKNIQVKDDDKVIFEGIAVDLNSQGALLVRNECGIQRSFDFGEISIR